MGVDFLDLSMELEKRFGVRIEPDDVLTLWTSHENDCTAGQLHDLVCGKCRELGLIVPRSSWNRVKIALVNSLGVYPSEIKKDTWLKRELGFN